MEDLNLVASEYKPDGKTQFENSLMLSWYPKRIIQKIPNSKELSLLELGIGHGYTTPYFYNHFKSHTVLDGSSFAIEQFKKNNSLENLEIVETYFENFNSSMTYDVIIMGFILEHVDDPEYILNYYRKFLAPSGRMFIAVPNAKSLNRRLGLALGKISDIYSLNENDLRLGHKRNYCIDTLIKTIKSCKYTVKHIEGIYLKPLPLGYMEKMPDFEENLQAMLEVGIDFPELSVAILLEVENV